MRQERVEVVGLAALRGRVRLLRRGCARLLAAALGDVVLDDDDGLPAASSGDGVARRSAGAASTAGADTSTAFGAGAGAGSIAGADASAGFAAGAGAGAAAVAGPTAAGATACCVEAAAGAIGAAALPAGAPASGCVLIEYSATAPTEINATAATAPSPIATPRSVPCDRGAVEAIIDRERPAAVLEGCDAGVTSGGMRTAGTDEPDRWLCSPVCDAAALATGEPSSAPNGNGRGSNRPCMNSPSPDCVERSLRSRAKRSRSAASSAALP